MMFRWSFLLTLVLSLDIYSAQTLNQFRWKPKLVLLIVLDQFRSDYLTRFETSFLPSQSLNKIGGFKYLMNEGAYYPYADYNIFQAMTCPGHSMIMTGAYPSESGISLNDWYDRDSSQMVYCVEDKEFGVSPRRLKSTTVSDEYKNINQPSKVVSIALKDRSAITLGGQRADEVLWINDSTFQWQTNKFYGEAPNYLNEVNSSLSTLKGKSYFWKEMNRNIPYSEKTIFSSPFGIQMTIDLALTALENEKLGQNSNQTDFLLISLSSHDLAGHQFGLNSPEMKEMTLFEDKEISRLLNIVEKKIGLNSTLIFLTGDHGIPSSAEYLQRQKISSGTIDYLKLYKVIYKHLDEKYGAPKAGAWIEAYKYFNFYLNQKVLKDKKLDESVIAQEIKLILQKELSVESVYTKSEIQKGMIAPGYWSEALQNQFNLTHNGDVIFMPEPFFYEDTKSLVTHMTGYNYDTRVPLILAGKPFKSGVYSENAKIVDLVPTLSFVLNLVSPPKARGRVLNESLVKIK